MTALRERRILRGEGERVANFAEGWIVQTKGRWANHPLVLEPWQRSLFEELFLVYEDGARVYDEALLGVARKNGKSTVSAVLALYMLLASGEEGPEVYAAAASTDQARIVFTQAKQFVEASPALSDWLTPQRNVILCPANNGIFRVLSSDAPLQYGLNPSGVVIDELWAHKNPELYYALTTAQGARYNPLVVSITTAGWDRESVCFDQYERGMTLLREGGIAAMRRAGFYFKWYEADPTADIRDPKGWLSANPSRWINAERLRREADRIPENVFRRLYLNQWTEAEDAWVKPHEWDACEGKPKLDPTLPTWGAVDVAYRHDTATITFGQWRGNSLHTRQRIIDPEEEGRNFGIGDVRALVASEMRQFHDLREMNYDPWHFQESAELLSDAGHPMVEFPQNSSRMEPASNNIYELVTERRLVHDGDRTARNHVLAAVTAPTERGGWKISKRKSQERIDYAVSLAMTADRAIAMRHVKPKRVFFT